MTPKELVKRLKRGEEWQLKKIKESEMSADRIDYIERLIDGVREEIFKDVIYHHGEKCYPSQWINAVILCNIIEREVLPDLKSKQEKQ